MLFYVYMYLRENGTPYYVGKGKESRVYKVSKNHYPPEDRTRILIQEFSSEEEAFAAEQFFIEYYGRKDLGTGCLRNLTDGGEGTSGRRGCSERGRQVHRKFGRRAGKIFGFKLGKIYGAINVENGHLARIRTKENCVKGGIAGGRQNVINGNLVKMQQLPYTKLRQQETGALAAISGQLADARKLCNHVRWHVNRSIHNPACHLCIEKVKNEPSSLS
jgi:hypothetical protein